MGNNPPAVLIVDDQPRNLDALEVMLAPVDCSLVRAYSADEALLQLLRQDFAAIVLDIKMPGTSGIELATPARRRRPATRRSGRACSRTSSWRPSVTSSARP
jgi:CheY-like chemotaxis protein